MQSTRRPDVLKHRHWSLFKLSNQVSVTVHTRSPQPQSFIYSMFMESLDISTFIKHMVCEFIKWEHSQNMQCDNSQSQFSIWKVTLFVLYLRSQFTECFHFFMDTKCSIWLLKHFCLFSSQIKQLRCYRFFFPFSFSLCLFF